MQTPGKLMQKLDWLSSLDFQTAFVAVTGKGRHEDGGPQFTQGLVAVFGVTVLKGLDVGNAVIAT